MTRLLLDTHAVLWWLTDDPALPSGPREAIADPANEVLVSTASLWEMAIKASLGKLTVPDDLPAAIGAEGFTWLQVRREHAWEVRLLPLHHRDPFDRLLVAQARVEGTPLLSGDQRLGAYDVDRRW